MLQCCTIKWECDTTDHDYHRLSLTKVQYHTYTIRLRCITRSVVLLALLAVALLLVSPCSLAIKSKACACYTSDSAETRFSRVHRRKEIMGCASSSHVSVMRRDLQCTSRRIGWPLTFSLFSSFVRSILSREKQKRNLGATILVIADPSRRRMCLLSPTFKRLTGTQRRRQLTLSRMVGEMPWYWLIMQMHLLSLPPVLHRRSTFKVKVIRS